MTPFILYRDARLIELDLLEMSSLSEEQQSIPDLRPTLRKFSDRVGRLADQLEQLAPASAEETLNARRWELLFNTAGVRVVATDQHVKVFQRIVGGWKLLGMGEDHNEAADKALGIK